MVEGDVPTRALTVLHHDAAEEDQGQAEKVQHHRPSPPERPFLSKGLIRRAVACAAAPAGTAEQAVQTKVETVEPADKAVQPAPPTQIAAADVLLYVSAHRCPETDYSAAVQGMLSMYHTRYLPPVTTFHM